MTVRTLIRKSDAQLKEDVLNELKWDPRVDHTSLGVLVRGGVVTLTGRVGSFARKLAAQEAAHRVAGVLDVANEIVVEQPRGVESTDEQIVRAVRHALQWDALVPDEQIHSTVTAGWVTLEGMVETLQEKDEASRAVRSLAGVVGVSNDITVRVQPLDARHVREAVEAALDRQAHREARRIDIDVTGDTLTITGRVRSWPERRAVLNAASCAKGVRAVVDHLVIDPYD
ncbi:MAG: BON domain-containing protein [Planctomycetota bacterium]|jgi:osmotically-inducible protein OsmY